MYQEYNEAIGAVMTARFNYTESVAASGQDSEPAIEANHDLEQAIVHRDATRIKYDATPKARRS